MRKFVVPAVALATATAAAVIGVHGLSTPQHRPTTAAAEVTDAATIPSSTDPSPSSTPATRRPKPVAPSPTAKATAKRTATKAASGGTQRPASSGSSAGRDGAAVSGTSSGTWFGWTAQPRSGETLADAVARQGRTYGPGMVRLYYPGMPAPWSRIVALSGDRPATVSFKMDPSQVMAGTFDAGLRAWFASAPNRTMYWSYHPEPENDIDHGAFTAAQFRSAYAHVAQIARSFGGDQLQSTWMIMCWTARPGSGRDWRSYWPGSDAVDVVAFDCANKQATAGRYSEPETMLKDPVALARSVGKPWGLGEFESRLVPGDSGADRAGWLLEMARFLQSNDAAFANYFDANRAVDFTLSDAASRLAWRSVVMDQRA